MKKIFRYELKRFLWNKFFLGLLAVTLFYGWQILKGDVIVGIASTAPFSAWSFGYYLSKVMPLLLITLLFFVSRLFSTREYGVRTLTEASPVDQVRYQLVRCSAMVMGYAAMCAAVIVLGCIFYCILFGFTGFGSLLLPAAITFIPAMVFLLGLGMVGGSVNCIIPYVLMIGVLALGFLPLPYSIDLLGSSFFAGYPIDLKVMDPVFTIPVSVIIGKTGYILAGLLLVGVSLRLCLVKTLKK